MLSGVDERTKPRAPTPEIHAQACEQGHSALDLPPAWGQLRRSCTGALLCPDHGGRRRIHGELVNPIPVQRERAHRIHPPRVVGAEKRQFIRPVPNGDAVESIESGFQALKDPIHPVRI